MTVRKPVQISPKELRMGAMVLNQSAALHEARGETEQAEGLRKCAGLLNYGATTAN